MTKGSIVRFGWYYRRKPIYDSISQIGIIVSDILVGWCTTEKLYKRKNKWYLKYDSGFTDSYKVLIGDNIKLMATMNLIEVKK